jgi:hypothetical protein
LDGGDSSVAGVTFGAFTYLSAGSFEVPFTTTRSGNFFLEISVDGAVVGGAAAPFKVEPNLLHGTATQVDTSQFASLVAGGPHTFSVTGVDQYGNVHSSGGLDLSAVLDRSGWTPASLAGAVTVVKGTHGASACTVTVTRTGDYSLALELTGDGLTTGGGSDVVSASPYLLTASAEEAAPASSISFAAAAAELSGIAGVAAAFVMQEVDAFGNLRSVSGEAFDVQLVPGGGEATITDLADGTYTVEMSPTQSGTYGVTVALAGGAELATNSFALTILPNNVSWHATTKVDYGVDYVDGGNSVDGVNGFAVEAHTPHPAPYTLHPAPCTLHSTPCILHPTPYTLRPTP